MIPAIIKLVGVLKRVENPSAWSNPTANKQMRKVSGNNTGIYTLATIIEISDRKNVLSKEVNIALDWGIEVAIVK